MAGKRRKGWGKTRTARSFAQGKERPAAPVKVRYVDPAALKRAPRPRRI